jgi:hypothetical protein
VLRLATAVVVIAMGVSSGCGSVEVKSTVCGVLTSDVLSGSHTAWRNVDGTNEGRTSSLGHGTDIGDVHMLSLGTWFCIWTLARDRRLGERYCYVG